MLAPPRPRLPLPPPPAPALLPPPPPHGDDSPTVYAPVRIHLAAFDALEALDAPAPEPKHTKLYSPYAIYDQDQDVASAQAQDPVRAAPLALRQQPGPTHHARWGERHPALVATLVFVALLALIGGAVLGASEVLSWIRSDVIEPYAPPE